MARTLSPTLDPRSRVWCLGAGFACALPMLRLVPGWLAATVLALSVLSAALAWKRPAPGIVRFAVTVSLVVVVLYAFGFRAGRDSGSALLLAMLMIKPIELNVVRDARSLLGFGMFALFAAFLLDQGPLTLVLALPAAVLVYAGSARLADAEIGTIGAGTNWPRIGTILGLFALALPLALAGFWLFPRLGSPMWGVPDLAKAKVGISDSMAPGDWLDILSDDTPAFRVRFDGPIPPQQALYWRGLVMWNFGGRAWTLNGWPHALPPAAIVPRGRPRSYELTLEPTDRRWMFALDVPMSAPEGTQFDRDRTLTTAEPIANLHAYSITSVDTAAFEPDLDPMVRAAALRLPPGFDPRSVQLARGWRDDAGADDSAIVRRALAMYHADFSYSLAAPPLGRDSVDEFLFDTKIGFCEHFSSSFTFLMRAAGIPARVVTGYVGGYRNRIGGFVLVRQSDAHAWSEVWLRGRGWVRIDPTAAVAPERVFKQGPAATGPGGGTLGDLFDVGDWLRRGWNDMVLRFSAARQEAMMRALGMTKPEGRTLAIAFAVVTGLLLVAITLFQLRDRGPRPDPLLRAWARFVARLARAGLGKAPHEPALAFAERVAGMLPRQRDDVLSLSRRFADARYAPAAPDDAVRRALIDALRRFRVRPQPRT